MHDNPVDPHSWMIGIDSWVIQVTKAANGYSYLSDITIDKTDAWAHVTEMTRPPSYLFRCSMRSATARKTR